MWPELKEQIELEEALLWELLDLHRPLLEKCRSEEPTVVELSALAATLHSFYAGAENLFRRIAIELDRQLPTGETWHQLLLEAMTTATERRPRVLDDELRDQLKKYLDFRHVFRNAYLFQLRWNKMAPLVRNLESVMEELAADLTLFSERMEKITEGG
ncbi:MAG: hypothetical protein GY856_39805 [bacterium]|nr:hypothetical protein [bacterium]